MRTALGRLVIVFASALACAFGPMIAHAKPFPEGTDALFIGHSFFVPISRNFDDIASAKHPLARAICKTALGLINYETHAGDDGNNEHDDNNDADADNSDKYITSTMVDSNLGVRILSYNRISSMV